MTRKKQTIDIITNNLTGERMDEADAVTVEFTVHGQAYIMDVTRDEADEFHKVLKKYEDAADKVVTKAKARSTPETSREGINEWRRANGAEPGKNGKFGAVPKKAKDEWDALPKEEREKWAAKK